MKKRAYEKSQGWNQRCSWYTDKTMNTSKEEDEKALDSKQNDAPQLRHSTDLGEGKANPKAKGKTPEKEEIHDREYNARLKDCRSIIFTIDCFFGPIPIEIYVYKQCGTKVIVTSPGYSIQSTEAKHRKGKTGYGTWDELIAKLQNLHMGRWDSHYENLEILDGMSWELKILDATESVIASFSGMNAFPSNMADLYVALKLQNRMQSLEEILS